MTRSHICTLIWASLPFLDEFLVAPEYGFSQEKVYVFVFFFEFFFGGGAGP